MMIQCRWSVLSAGLAIGLLACAGCTPTPPAVQLHVWAVSGSHRVRPDQPARRETDCYSHQDQSIRLTAARNEVVACQLVLRAEANPIENVKVTVGELAGQITNIPASAVRAYRPLYIGTVGTSSSDLIRGIHHRPGQTWPDGLVPLDSAIGARSFDVPAKTSLPVWIDVTVGRQALPGPYRATVSVSSHELVVAQVELHIEVLPFVLPARPGLAMLTGVDMPTLLRYHLERDGKPYAPGGIMPGDSMAGQAKAVLDRTMQMLHAHRCSPFLIGVYPSVTLDAAGKMQVGWDIYDRTVSDYVDGATFVDRQRASAWPMPLDVSFPPPASYGGANAPAYASAVTRYLKQSAEHFRQKGWLGKHFVWTGPPDARNPEPPERVKRFGSLVKKAGGGLRFLTTAIPQPMKPFGWPAHRFDPTMAEYVSIWSPPAQFFDAATMARQRANGRDVWMTVDRPPFSPSLTVGAPQADPRGLAWQAFRYSIDGILIPVVNGWTGDPLSGVLPMSSQWLIYPGGTFGVDGPIPSIRLKQLRRGLQDLEYLTILRGIGQREMAETIARALFRYGGSAAYVDHFADGCQWPWVEDPELWDLARRLMAQRIAQAQGRAGGSDQQFAQTVEWKRFIGAACKLRVFSEGVRVRSTGQTDAAAGAEVTFHIVIRNERPKPVTGRLRFGKLPPGWLAVTDSVPIDSLPCLGRARVSLVAHATSIETNEAGLAYIPIVLDAGSQGTIEIQARLALVTARRLDRPIALDGALADWPAGIGNVAGDFVGVAGRRGSEDRPGQADRPNQGTLAFVGYDQERLYVAFNCREDRVDKLPSTSSNFIRYDGLLPAGDDLIEIMIDPSNAGTGRAADIYHIAVRPTGAVLVHRGVSTGSGWGSSRVWAADVRVAPRLHAKERSWTVEVSIPLSAFDKAARANKRWAVNLARYQSQTGEYSSWSGARRYTYNTRSFGNLAWP